MTYIPEDGHRRWAWVSTTHQGAPGLSGAPKWVCAHLVGLVWYIFALIFFIYSIKNLREVSACLELCKIGGLT